MVSVENLRESLPPEKKINLDLGEQRRHSFLPENWTDGNDGKRETTIKNIRVLEFNEDDDLFMYMQPTTAYEEKPLQKFCTGSKYLGHWNKLGIAGKGVYKYPHGVIYDGYFNRNGEFHGTGILVYPNGHRIEGTWKNGKLGPDCQFIAKAGVVMSKNYCIMPDRRFQIEFENDFNPVGHEYETDEVPPPRYLPEGCYDVVEGFFDPKINSVVSYPTEHRQRVSPSSTRVQAKSATRFLYSEDDARLSDFSEVIEKTESESHLETLMRRKSAENRKAVSWIPSVNQEEWIVRHCRKAWDVPTGYRPDLYEEWTKGGNICIDQDYDGAVDSKHQLKHLNLDGEKETPRRFMSFVQNRKEQHDSITIDILSKMFRSQTAMRSTMDIKMFAVTRYPPSDDSLFTRPITYNK